VANWRILCFQTEEENREGTDCQPIEMEACRDMVLANTYMFRVIRVDQPYHNSIRLWEGCENVEFVGLHNYSQIKFTNDNSVYDINRDIEVRPWELQNLTVTGREPRREPLADQIGQVQRLARGFEFAEGIAVDSRGNVYFSEQRMRRIYRWSAATQTLSLVSDMPWEPMSLGVDTQDNLLVVFRYRPQPGYAPGGEQERPVRLPDSGGTSFAMYGNDSYETRAYSIDPRDPENSVVAMPKVAMGSVARVAKALYPSNRWRDFHDFNTVVTYRPAECFVAPDGVTIIPCQYDLARGSGLLEAVPGKPFYASDEYDKRIVRMNVAEDGGLWGLEYFVEWGEFGSAVDDLGNLYVADGDIHVFAPDGTPRGSIRTPERPSSMAFGGGDGRGGRDVGTLFFTARGGLYRVRVK
jgi:sugar lactone lactonase YvrE